MLSGLFIQTHYVFAPVIKESNLPISQGFRFGGHLGDRPGSGSAGGAPRTPENCKKWIILGDFSKEIKNPSLNFRALDEKKQLFWDLSYKSQSFF